jgi:hypothetical protein
MKKYYNLAIGVEIASAVLYIKYIRVKPLGSDLIFTVLLIASIVNIFLFWQSFKNITITGLHKRIGIGYAFLPIVFYLSLLHYTVTNYN